MTITPEPFRNPTHHTRKSQEVYETGSSSLPFHVAHSLVPPSNAAHLPLTSPSSKNPPGGHIRQPPKSPPTSRPQVFQNLSKWQSTRPLNLGHRRLIQKNVLQRQRAVATYPPKERPSIAKRLAMLTSTVSDGSNLEPSDRFGKLRKWLCFFAAFLRRFAGGGGGGGGRCLSDSR